MDNILLSIIIPTYNGGEYLKQNLNYLVPMVQHYNNTDLELIISNNGSEDNTELIVLEWVKVFSRLKYVKRSKNIGAMENFERSTYECRGKFVLLLGDDDILLPGSIDFIMNLLHRCPNLSLLHWNRIDYLMKDNSATLYNRNFFTPFVKYYNLPEEFIKNHATMDSMSTILFRKVCWADIPKDKEETYWGYIWYAKLLYGMLGFHGLNVYVNYPLVIQRHPNVRNWSSKRPLYVAGLLNIYKDLDDSIPGLYKFYQDNYPTNSAMFFLTMVNIIAENKLFYKDKIHILTRHNTKLWRKIMLYSAIFINPIPVTKGLVILCKALVKLLFLFK